MSLSREIRGYKKKHRIVGEKPLVEKKNFASQRWHAMGGEKKT
jgi:hypothetical protein